MAKNELTGSAWLDQKAYLKALPTEQLDQVITMAEAIKAQRAAGKPQEKTGVVLLVREPGYGGKVTDVGFIHHVFETDDARVSDNFRTRINLRPARKDQDADAEPNMAPTGGRR